MSSMVLAFVVVACLALATAWPSVIPPKFQVAKLAAHSSSVASLAMALDEFNALASRPGRTGHSSSIMELNMVHVQPSWMRFQHGSDLEMSTLCSSLGPW